MVQEEVAINTLLYGSDCLLQWTMSLGSVP